jgi:hypothetical protein
MIGHQENPLRALPLHAATSTGGGAVISFGVIASRVRRQEKKKAMRAGTVAS